MLAAVFAVVVLILSVALAIIFNKFSDARFGFEIANIIAVMLMVAAAAVAGWLAGKSASATPGADPVLTPIWAGLITGIAAWAMFILVHLVELILLWAVHGPKIYGGQQFVLNNHLPFFLLGSCCYGPVVLIFCIAVAVLVAAFTARKKVAAP